MLWCVSCPALADYGVSDALRWYPLVSCWYPLAGSGMSHGVLWLCSGMSQCYPLGVLWLALAGSGCALVCLIAGYALMMSCVKIDHTLAEF